MVRPDPELPWAEAARTLLALAACDLDDGVPPRPRLVAHRGDEALVVASLRPFERGEVLDAVIELLALVVPLGADRVGFALPCRVWSLDDPSDALTGDGGIDLRQPAVVVGLADGHDGACRSSAAVHPFSRGPDGEWRWEEPFAPDEAPEAPLLSALQIILDGRQELGSDHEQLRAQLERVLELGHGLALSATAVRELPPSPLVGLAARSAGSAPGGG